MFRRIGAMFGKCTFKGIGVVPPMFISGVAMSMVLSAIPDLLMQKCCSPEGEPDVDQICYNAHSISQATEIASMRSAVRSFMSAISVPWFATWRDSTGRSKPLIIIGMAAEMVCTFINLGAVMIWPLSPWYSSMIEACIGGLLGKAVLHMGAQCIIIENSAVCNRTLRLQLYMTTDVLSSCLGSILYGYLLTTVGYKVFFSSVAALNAVAIVIAFVFISNKIQDSRVRVNKKVCSELKSIFKSRKNMKVIWIMVVCSAIVDAYLSAENSIMIYYLQQAFSFTVVEEGLYEGYNYLFASIGSFVLPFIFNRILKWSDFKIGRVSALVTAVSSSILAFARTRLYLYNCTILGLLKCVLLTIPESIICRCVNNDELGKFLAMTTIIESFLPFGLNYIYSMVFSFTSRFMPGAFFLLSATINIIVLILFRVSSFFFEPDEDVENTNAEEHSYPSSSAKIWIINKGH